jgi:hypothetical protein
MERRTTMSKNHADSVQQNRQEHTEESREIGEEALAEKVLAKVTGGGGILDVLNHQGYFVAHTIGAVPPSEVPMRTAIKPIGGIVNQEVGHTSVVYRGASGAGSAITVQTNPHTTPVTTHGGARRT